MAAAGHAEQHVNTNKETTLTRKEEWMLVMERPPNGRAGADPAINAGHRGQLSQPQSVLKDRHTTSFASLATSLHETRYYEYGLLQVSEDHPKDRARNSGRQAQE